MNYRQALIGGVAVIVVIGTLLFTIRRDLRFDQEYTIDLRSRVVGARLIEDGRNPYFYKWKTGDGIRYYDRLNFDSLTVSDITASPFFLHLLSPIADWPEASISRFWLALEYLMLLVITAICWQTAATTQQKLTVLVFSLLFLLTNAWKQHIQSGQSYLLIPLLATLFYSCLRRGTAWWWGALAGLLAIGLLLIRVNSLFFFLPFLLLWRRYPRRWLLAFTIAPILLSGWSLLNGHERRLWQGYSVMLDQQIRWHQGLPYHTQYNTPDPGFTQWEGIDMVRAHEMKAADSDNVNEDNANVFWILRKIVHVNPSETLVEIVSLGLIGALFVGFCIRRRPFQRLSLEQVALLGYGLYMLSDLTSPVVIRHQYPGVQWLFPVLLAGAILHRRQGIVLAGLFAGVLLNIFHFPLVRMHNTTGEYLLLTVILLLSLVPDKTKTSKPLPARVS
jgi:hypothetical protein